MSYRYLLFYKPYGVLTQFSDPDRTGHPTLADFVKIAQIYAAGRLDRDSEGLLLLTNHGLLQHRLCDPKFAHPRTYWVQVENLPTAEAIARLSSGIKIQDYFTRPAQVRLLEGEPNLPRRPVRYRAHIPTAWLEITLTEGKNRQVRRMTAAVGYPTLRLVRVKIAHLELGSLQPGEWRELDYAAVKPLLG
ncbi:MAG: pseudouridine synthase [Pseudanabaenaceae cyanobacterium bins.68]|nr:pseudouridine synthase [Pseudanabaenaceae cyanobacterium bins.68]